MDTRIGVVEDIHDPLMIGRVRVRIIGIHSPERAILPTHDLPWAMCLNTTAQISGVGNTGCQYLAGSWCLCIAMDEAWQTIVLIGAFPGVPQDLQSTYDISNNSIARYTYKADSDGIYLPSANKTANKTADNSPIIPVEEGGSVILPVTDAKAEAVGPLTAEEYILYRERVAQNESGYGRRISGGWDVVNQKGFSGRYQFGTLALVDTKFMKTNRASNSEQRHPEHWNTKLEVTSLDTWLTTPDAQNDAMLNLTQINFNRLKQNQVLRNDSDKAHVCGVLYAAHLLGATGATRWLKNGINKADANGFTAQKAYDWAKTALTYK